MESVWPCGQMWTGYHIRPGRNRYEAGPTSSRGSRLLQLDRVVFGGQAHTHVYSPQFIKHILPNSAPTFWKNIN